MRTPKKGRRQNGQKKKGADDRMVKRKRGQTTEWSKEKRQKDKQRSTKHTHKT